MPDVCNVNLKAARRKTFQGARMRKDLMSVAAKTAATGHELQI